MTPFRLGFPVKVLGRKGLKSNDSRRWQSGPHLRVSLEYLRAIFEYLSDNGITMYRISSDLAPYATHPDLPQFHHQIAECSAELRDIGRSAREQNLRLSFHPSQFIVLNSPDEGIRRKSIWDLQSQADLMDAMELGPEAVMVIHAGGAYGDTQTGIERWVRTYESLSEPIRRRLVLENDDIRYDAADVLAIHGRTGVPLIFDNQHHLCLNRQGLASRETLERFLHTWPATVRPKVHFSSPRTEMREVTRKNRKTGKNETVLMPPIWTGHADFTHPFEFIAFMREMDGLEFDVMLEAKAKDLALLRLRQDLVRFAPDVASKFGIAGDLPDRPIEVLVEELEGSDAVNRVASGEELDGSAIGNPLVGV